MSCAFGCGEHNDLRVLPCKTVVCFKCINERLVIIQLNCLICKRIHLIPYPSQLKRQTNIEVAQNHSNNNLLQPLQPTDSSRNQIYGKNNSNIYRDFQWPDSNIIIPSFIFALLIFPISIFELYSLRTTISECNEISPWFIMWVIICTLELILSILNQGFLEEGLEELKGIEKALRIMWFACTGFVIVWAIIGFVWMSGYQECRDRYNDFWANSLFLLDVVCLSFMNLGIYKLKYFKIHDFVSKKDYIWCFTVVHLMVFESTACAGIIYLFENPDFSRMESIWLIVWIFASLVSFFVWNFSLFLNSSYADLILGFSIVISLLLCVLVFIGASMIFMDESCKKGSTYLESYYLWVICSAISAFWINIFGVIFLRYLSIFLHANGVTEFKPFESGIFAVVHIILFEITNYFAILTLISGVECSGLEREWLIMWVTVSLTMLVTWLLFINSEDRYSDFYAILSTIFMITLVILVILGGYYIIFNDECENDGYDLWRICATICEIWLTVFALMIGIPCCILVVCCYKHRHD